MNVMLRMSVWLVLPLYTCLSDKCGGYYTSAVSSEIKQPADSVAQAAGAPILSLQRGVFAGMRALGLAGYRWALLRISSYYSYFYRYFCYIQAKFHTDKNCKLYLCRYCPCDNSHGNSSTPTVDFM